MKEISDSPKMILRTLFFLLICSTSFLIAGQAQETIYINNYADLEAWLCSIITVLQYGSIILGAVIIGLSLAKQDWIIPNTNLKLTKRTQLVAGCCLVIIGFLLGFLVPPILIWLIERYKP